MNLDINGLKFTTSDLDALWSHHQVQYFLDVLNGDYDLTEAREDLRSLIGSKYDPRCVLDIQNKKEDEQ